MVRLYLFDLVRFFVFGFLLFDFWFGDMVGLSLSRLADYSRWISCSGTKFICPLINSVSVSHAVVACTAKRLEVLNFVASAHRVGYIMGNFKIPNIYTGRASSHKAFAVVHPLISFFPNKLAFGFCEGFAWPRQRLLRVCSFWHLDLFLCVFQGTKVSFSGDFSALAN